MCLSVSVCLSVCLSACLPACLLACLCVCLSVCLPVCLSVCLPVCLSVCLSVCPSVCQCVCLTDLSVCLCQPPSEVEWLISELSRGGSVGADPRLLSAQDWLHIDRRLRGEVHGFREWDGICFRWRVAVPSPPQYIAYVRLVGCYDPWAIHPLIEIKIQ